MAISVPSAHRLLTMHPTVVLALFDLFGGVCYLKHLKYYDKS